MAERRNETGQRPSTGRGESESSTRQGRSESDRFPVTRGQGRSLSRGMSSPFSMIQELSDEMSRLFHHFGFARDFGFRGWNDQNWVPQVDVLRDGSDVVVRADLPGLARDDIAVDVTEGMLTIRGERREEHEEERGGYYWHERNEGSFQRSIPLPDNADPDQASAHFDNGVLEVRVPAPEAEPRSRGRRIEIR